MQQKVYIGGVSPQGEQLITKYLEAFAPDAELLPIKASGIKGMMKTKAPRPDVLLVIIEDSLAQLCEDVASETLALPKVHRYMSDDDLKDFLITKFGKLEGVEVGETDFSKMDTVVEEDDLSIYMQPKGIEHLGEVPAAHPTPIAPTPQPSVYTPVQPDYTSQGTRDNNEVNRLLNRISELEAELNAVQNNAPNSSEVAALKARIAELEADDETKEFVQLGKLQKAEQVLKQYDEIKKKLSDYKEQVAILTHDKNTLTEEKDGFVVKVASLEENINTLTAEVTELSKLKVEVANLNEVIENKDNELKIKSTEIEGKVAEICGLNARIDELSGVVDECNTLKESVKNLTLDKNNLEADLRSANSTIETAKNKLAETKSDLDIKTAEYDNLSEKYTQLQSDSSRAVEEVESLKAEVDEKRKTNLSLSTELTEKIQKLNESTETISTLNEEMTNLRNDLNSAVNDKNTLRTEKELAEQKIKALNDRVSELTDSIQDIHGDSNAEIGRLNADINRLTIDLQQEKDSTALKIADYESKIANMMEQSNDLTREKIKLERQLADKEAVINTMMSDASASDDANNAALQKLIAERDALTDKIASSESTAVTLREQVTSLQVELTTVNDQLGEKEVTISKLENLISSLRNSVAETGENTEEIKNLQDQLFQSQQTVIKLNSELDVLRQSDNSEKLALLKEELTNTKAELENLRNNNASKAEIDSLLEQLDEQRRINSDLQLDISDMNEELSEYTNSIFTHIADMALPKAANNVTVADFQGMFQRFYCIASGTMDSNRDVYEAVYNTAQSIRNARILFVDLVSDTSLDSYFNIQAIQSPVDWLSGKSSFRNFVSATNLQQVRVLSTGFAYFNDLFLLQVNWQQRLQELVGYADIVIINIGCLSNAVTKIMFNTFYKCMRTYVITKATPINLRSIILTMAGFLNLNNNVLIACTDFDQQSSRGMYQRLQSKYRAIVLNDNYMLQL